MSEREQQVLDAAITYGDTASALNEARIALNDAFDRDEDDETLDRLAQRVRDLEDAVSDAQHDLRLSAGLLALNRRLTQNKEI